MPKRRITAGPDRATDRAAPTKCARSKCSDWKPTRISTPSRRAYRAKAKEVHPDVKPGDADAARQFQQIQVAYEVLEQAEERREWKG